MEKEYRLNDPTSLKEAHLTLKEEKKGYFVFCARMSRMVVTLVRGSEFKMRSAHLRHGWFISVMERGMYWFDPPVHGGYVASKLLMNEVDAQNLSHFINIVTAETLEDAHYTWEQIMLADANVGTE